MVSPYTFLFPCFKQVVHPSGILPREKAGETWSQQIFLCFVKPLSIELIILVCWSSRREKGRSLSGSQREWRVSSAVRQWGESSEAPEGVETGQQFPGNIPQSGANRRVAVGMPRKAAPEASELSLPLDYRALSGPSKCQGLLSWRNHADWCLKITHVDRWLVASSDPDALLTQGSEPLALTQVEFPFNLGQK